MRKLISIFFCFLILTSSAFAVEYLQVDAADDDGVLYSSSGAIVPKSHDFTLYTLVDLDAKKDALDATYYISAALIPKFSETPPDDFDYGSFTFNGISYEVNYSNICSRSDEDDDPKNDDNLGGTTGVLRYDSNLTTFDSYTFYFEYSFTFLKDENGEILRDENGEIVVKYSEGGTPWGVGEVADSGNTLAYAAFDINTTKLDFFDVRFDLYTLTKSGNIQFTSATTHYVQTAPEPGTMLLFGFGLIWMARMGRKKLL